MKLKFELTRKIVHTMFRLENFHPDFSEKRFVSQTQDALVGCDVFHQNIADGCFIPETQDSKIDFSAETKKDDDDVMVRSHWRRLPKKTSSKRGCKTPLKQARVAKMDIASHKEIRRTRQKEDKELKANKSSERDIAAVNEWKNFWSLSSRKVPDDTRS